jgi:hypothetical protein
MTDKICVVCVARDMLKSPEQAAAVGIAWERIASAYLCPSHKRDVVVLHKFFKKKGSLTPHDLGSSNTQ